MSGGIPNIDRALNNSDPFLRRNKARIIGRCVVEDNDRVIGIRLLENALKAPSQVIRAVVGHNVD